MSTARHRNPVAQRGFTQAENALVFDRQLSAGALRLYLALKHYAWRGEGTIPKQAEVADSIGVSERALRDHYKELEARRLVTVDRKPRGNVVVIEDVTPANSSGVATAEIAALDRQKLPTLEAKTEDSPSPNGSGAREHLDELLEAATAEGMPPPHAANRSARAGYFQILRGFAAEEVRGPQLRRMAQAYRRHETLGQTMLTLAALAKWWNTLEATGATPADRLRERMERAGVH